MAKQINDIEPYPSRSLQEYILQQGYLRAGINVDDVDISASLDYKNKITLNIPILSAPMQSVTGSGMAIALARLGGSGVIYCSQHIDEEVRMVKEVKRFKAGFVSPETLSPNDSIEDAYRKMQETGYSKFPVIKNGKLLGLLTDNDFYYDLHKGMKVYERMRPIGELNVALDTEINDDIKLANNKLKEGHHSVLPIINKDGKLKYLVFRKDMVQHEENPFELLDKDKRYIVGAAINTQDNDYEERSMKLVDAGADFLVIDTSHGYSEYVEKTMKYLKKKMPEIPVIGGNVITQEGFMLLADIGVDAVKVGMGSGSICVTQEQIRVGRGQAKAVIEVCKARDEFYKKTNKYIPICSDGGIRTSGDISIALALGADYVMAGGYLAGAQESPTEVDEIRREIDGMTMTLKVKQYWGEGSKRAKEFSGFRYGHRYFYEGFETVVPSVGLLRDHLLPGIAKVRDSIRKSGSTNIKELHENAVLDVMSPVSISLSRGKPVI